MSGIADKNPAIETVLAHQILEIIGELRNAPPAGDGDVARAAEGICYHAGRIEALVRAAKPIQLVLPAFPAKSANPEKTTGILPDLGEVIALRRLEALCVKIEEIYAPGAQLVICSDGRVFSDLVQVSDEAVSAYGDAIRAIIADEGLTHLTTYDLDDLFPGLKDHDVTRRLLVEKYAEAVEVVRERAASDSDARRMYNGIHRFLFEDLVVLNPGMSRTKVRDWAGALAYLVIQRSNAWSNLVLEQFPEAVRLSIHPQPMHSRKIGVQMVSSANIWRTPWHASVLFDGKEYTLVRRVDAEAMGAVLERENGRYAFFVMPGAVAGGTVDAVSAFN